MISSSSAGQAEMVETSCRVWATPGAGGAPSKTFGTRRRHPSSLVWAIWMSISFHHVIHHAAEGVQGGGMTPGAAGAGNSEAVGTGAAGGGLSRQ